VGLVRRPLPSLAVVRSVCPAVAASAGRSVVRPSPILVGCRRQAFAGIRST
ncbi:hypothetical protein Dimus_033715, partial [Dionaea muscipula]